MQFLLVDGFFPLLVLVSFAAGEGEIMSRTNIISACRQSNKSSQKHGIFRYLNVREDCIGKLLISF